ncbi:hypothetical protein P12x_001284 [Tundrisphaera lichenicola]|uniref:GAP1-M domain-containing protein n=1 Tax=Tundrisphaera lichenicola TaxID=2029860 RepID=UPI003EB6BD37
MDQIYYTQCPVGYGLGASNGFQVKRMSAGYPASGDFRHLGLRAFPGGSRALAPPTLRYRRDGEFAEIAMLTPRSHEYETERGLWGRPGGHFAHGIRLKVAELDPIRQWPAGLFESHLWCRTDRDPTRGRPPEEVELTPDVLKISAIFANVAALAEGIDPTFLSRLLTAMALVTRESRTLFIVDESDRLGPLIALLTFAFPEPFRSDLTFSTFHDRPEELPGYRIQGTIHASRPNRASLLALGVIADRNSGKFEPEVESAPWASTLAGWLVRRDPVAEADWSATETRARTARHPEDGSAWSDAWLGHLFGFPGANRDRTQPGDPSAWENLRDYAEWSRRAGSGDEWIRHRGPSWWIDKASSCRTIAQARSALVAHATLREAWKFEVDHAAWGRAIGAWFRDAEARDCEDSALRTFRAAPQQARPSFARALILSLTPEGAVSLLDRLHQEPSCDRAMLLPMEATARISAILGGSDPAPIREIIEEALPLRGAISAVLDAIESGLVDRTEALPGLARWLTRAFEPDGGFEGISWALRRGKAASIWLGPALRPLFADLGRQEEWTALHDRTPEPLRASLARAILDVTREPGLPDEAFRWGIEGLLLTLAPRPHDPTWAESYLKRTPSGLDLLRRLGSPEYRKLGVLAWLKQARSLGEISEEQAARIDSCLAYARALSSTEPGAFQDVPVPSVPPDQRGLMLGHMISRIERAATGGLSFVLDACRNSWPGAFEPGTPGLRSMAAPLARLLAPYLADPSDWFDRLGEILNHLHLVSDQWGFEPDGLAAEVGAIAARLTDPPPGPWPLRNFLLGHQRAWRILTTDIRRELAEIAPDSAAEVLNQWDLKLDKQGRPERFFELFLNAARGPWLAACVLSCSADLETLAPLPWWDHALDPSGLDDLRDGFARTIPLAPFPEGRLFQVRRWVEGSRARFAPTSEGGSPGLSPLGKARWRCLEELTNFRNAVNEPAVRWPIVLGWKERLPIAALSVDDRHRLVAWIIEGLDEAESFQIAELASWLRRIGIKDHARLALWADEIGESRQIDDRLKIARVRLVADLKAELYRQLRESQAGRGDSPRLQAPR